MQINNKFNIGDMVYRITKYNNLLEVDDDPVEIVRICIGENDRKEICIGYQIISHNYDIGEEVLYIYSQEDFFATLEEAKAEAFKRNEIILSKHEKEDDCKTEMLDEPIEEDSIDDSLKIEPEINLADYGFTEDKKSELVKELTKTLEEYGYDFLYYEVDKFIDSYMHGNYIFH